MKNHAIRHLSAHLWMPTVFLAIAVWGFWPFYAEGLGYRNHPLTPEIRWPLIFHGVVMSLWLLLYWNQALWVALTKRTIHRAFGHFGALLAVIMTGQSTMIAIASVRLLPQDILMNMLSPKQFLIIPLFNVTVFALCVFVGLLCRKHPPSHRGLMGFATLSILSAAMGRIDVISCLYAGSWIERLSGPYLSVMTLGLIVSFIERWQKGCWNRSFLLALSLFSVSVPFVLLISRTPSWELLSTFLLDARHG